MAVFEKFLEEKRKTIAGPEVPKLTLKDIRSNDRESRLFGLYLEEQGEHDLGGRFAKKDELSPDDLNTFETHLEGYMELKKRSEHLLKTLDSKMIVQLLPFSPDLKALMSVAGPEGIRQALERYVPELAIADTARFETMEDHINELEKAHKEGTEQNAKIEKMYKQLGISEAEYMELMKGGDARSIAEKLVKPHWLRGRDAAQVEAQRLSIMGQAAVDMSDIQARVTHVNDRMRDIGMALRATFVDVPEMHKALIGGLDNEKPPKPTLMSFAEMRKGLTDPAAIRAEAKAILPSEEDLMDDWDVWLAANRADLNAHNVSPADAKMRFAQEYTALSRPTWSAKGGYWQQIFHSLVTDPLTSSFTAAINEIVTRKA